MLDHPEKTARLLAALKAAVPFGVELMPALIKHLKAKNILASNDVRQTVSDLSYAGDEGGIVCHIVPPHSLSYSCPRPEFNAVCTGSRRLPEASGEEAEKAKLQLSLPGIRRAHVALLDAARSSTAIATYREWLC